MRLATFLLGTMFNVVQSSVGLAQEEIYVDRGLTIDVFDPKTTAWKRSIAMPLVPRIFGMTHDGASLLAIDLNGFLPADVIEIHPATGAQKTLGTTGLAWNLSGLAHDLTTGVTYATYGDELFVVDPISGAVTSKGWFSGLVPFEHLCGFAINHAGEAYGLGYIDNTLYHLDLVTISATSMGKIALGGSGDFFFDAAFDSTGSLWGAWANLPQPGIYKIDVQSQTATFAFPYNGYAGIAIGPATPETEYCTAKANSLGCVPVLEPSGLASVSGAFGYEVRATNVRNNTMGRLLFTTAGTASTPFGGGTLCVATPWNGTPVVKSGGSAKPAQDCTGSWTYDLNAHFTANPGPSAGDTVYCQWVGRDRGFLPPDNYALSSALEFTLLP